TRLLTEAMTWIGTPLGRGQCIKQVGVDCGHFVDACFRAAGVDTKDVPSSHVSGEVILSLLEQSILLYTDRDKLQPADVIVFSDEVGRHPGEPVHMGFIHQITDKTTFIIEAGRLGVVRHRLNQLWWSRCHSLWTMSSEERIKLNGL